MIRFSFVKLRSFAYWLELCALIVLVASPTFALHVGLSSCGGIIPIDSQFTLDPLWSITPYRNSIVEKSGGSLVLEKGTDFSSSLKQIITSESGMNADSVVVFDLNAPSVTVAGNGVEGSEESANCQVELSPLLAAASGVIAKGGRIVLLHVVNADGATCSLPLEVSLTSASSGVSATLVSHEMGVQTFPPSFSFDSRQIPFPLLVSFPKACRPQVLLLLNKEGSIEEWYSWIPATVYSAVITALFIPTLFLGKRLHPVVTGLLLFLMYFGFLGSTIGLVLHLQQWQSSLGRMFPFPRAVTLYCCLPLLFVLYMVVLVLRCSRHKSTLFIGLLRLLVYGVNCALCVGYWVAGYVLLGSLSVFQYFATNVVLTIYFVYLVVKFNCPPPRRSTTGYVRGGLRPIRIPTSLTVLWFAPLTPFATCCLLYLDLYLLSGPAASSEGGLRIEDLVRIYNLHLSIPLLFFQNVYGIALLATATAYHMPYVVVLFPSLFLWGLHLIYSVEQYTTEWRRWRERGIGVAASTGWLSLRKAVLYLTEGEGAYADTYRPYRPPTTAAHPPHSLPPDGGYIEQLANEVEDDIERHGGGTLRSRSRSTPRPYRSTSNTRYEGKNPAGQRRSTIGVDDEEAFVFPPIPPQQNQPPVPSSSDDTSSGQSTDPPSPSPVATRYYGNSVYANDNIHSTVNTPGGVDHSSNSDSGDEPFWPNSVQR